MRERERERDEVLERLKNPELKSVSVHPIYRETPERGFLRTFWEPDRVLRSPLRALRVHQLPYKKSVSVHPVHGNPRTGLLRTF